MTPINNVAADGYEHHRENVPRRRRLAGLRRRVPDLGNGTSACMIHRWAVSGELEQEMQTALAADGALWPVRSDAAGRTQIRYMNDSWVLSVPLRRHSPRHSPRPRF